MAGLHNFDNAYKSEVNRWAKFDNTGQRPVSIEWGRGMSELDTPVIRGALAALNRAAEEARRIAIQTGTELIIMRDGEICSLSHEEIGQTDCMSSTASPSGYHYVVDEPLLRTIAAEIQAAIPGAEVRLFGSRARGTARPDSDLDLLVTVPDAWLATHSRLEQTDALGWKLAYHRLPIELLLFSASEVAQRRHGKSNVIAEAFRYGRQLDPAETMHGAG